MLPTKHGFTLLESVVLRKPRLPHEDEKAKEALIDCLLITLEAADDLGLQRTADYLDIATNIALAEVHSRRLSKPALTQVLRSTLEKAATNFGGVTQRPVFRSRRVPKLSGPEDTVRTNGETTRLSA